MAVLLFRKGGLIMSDGNFKIRDIKIEPQTLNVGESFIIQVELYPYGYTWDAMRSYTHSTLSEFTWGNLSCGN